MATGPHPYFKVGALVEINSDDPGFRGSWFEGKIVKRMPGKSMTQFLVSYTQMFEDDALTEPVTEIFDCVRHLRPTQPPATQKERESFKFGDEVDAYYNDGWWEGTITKDFGNGKFKVFFRGTREQIVFERDQLRVQREWNNGVWTPPLDTDEENPPDVEVAEAEPAEQVHVEKSPEKSPDVKPIEAGTVEKTRENTELFTPGANVEVSSDEEGFGGAWFSATVVRVLGKERFFVEYENLRTDDDSAKLTEEVDKQHIRPQPPASVVVDRFNLFEEVDAWYQDAWWIGVVVKCLTDSRYTVFFPDSKEELEFRHSELRLHQEWIDGKWFTMSHAVMP